MAKEIYHYPIEDVIYRAPQGKVYAEVVRGIEKILIEKVLARCFGNQIAAAKVLGINRNTLRAKINKLNIKVRRFKR